MPKKLRGMSDRRFVIAITVAVAGAALHPAFAAEPTTLQPGTYRQVIPATKKLRDPGNQIVFVRGKNGRLSFSVNAIRANDLNQGYVAGTLPANGSTVTWTQKEQGMDCKLTFTASATGMKVVQDDRFGDCGFGYGVVADGEYLRTASAGKLAPPGP